MTGAARKLVFDESVYSMISIPPPETWPMAGPDLPELVRWILVSDFCRTCCALLDCSCWHLGAKVRYAWQP